MDARHGLEDALPDSGPIDEAHGRVRQALYDHLMSLDASVVRQMLSEHGSARGSR